MSEALVPARAAAIIPAAGLSTRFGGNKLLASVDGKSVLERTICAFLDLRAEIDAVIIACPAGFDPTVLPFFDRIDVPRLQWVTGGDTRAHSVLAAATAASADIEWLAIHDAARPLVSPDLIRRCLVHAAAHGNASPAMPVKLTIKEAVGPLPAAVRRTLRRGDLWEMQTPQVMRRGDLLAAFATCPIALEQVTDDAQLLELAGYSVWLIPGDEHNLKITTPTDLLLADSIVRRP